MGNLFRINSRGFALNCGKSSPVKIDCDALGAEDLESLAYMASLVLPKFGRVYGVPTGGERFAGALRRYSGGDSQTLIADDVLTTGGSMERAKAVVAGKVIGVVIFARGPCPDWVWPLFVCQVPDEKLRRPRPA